MILQVHTEKELINKISSLEKTMVAMQQQSKNMVKAMAAMQATIDKKPNTIVKELTVKEVEKPTYTETTVIKTDSSVAPTLKKISDRLQALESKKPLPQIIKELTTHEVKTVDTASAKQIQDMKKLIADIKPVINNVTQGVTEADIVELISKHVTMTFVNKLYKKGR
jgi:hypothetical protein